MLIFIKSSFTNPCILNCSEILICSIEPLSRDPRICLTRCCAIDCELAAYFTPLFHVVVKNSTKCGSLGQEACRPILALWTFSGAAERIWSVVSKISCFMAYNWNEVSFQFIRYIPKDSHHMCVCVCTETVTLFLPHVKVEKIKINVSLFYSDQNVEV